ncbi:hypothetical protein SHKM778_43030 [Streptomyces sp. KM77-8]|uniref:HTH iclR-type domain-containing protein n=1 Tax=Streptomyces haneummycinicus TaxID=3074435 RepID=A0AAT9HKM7_9ACTN
MPGSPCGRRGPGSYARGPGALRRSNPEYQELHVPRRDDDPNFIEAIARGFDVIKAFDPHTPVMSLTEVATATGLARPTARRILLTLESLGYARALPAGGFTLTARVLELGLTYVQAMGLWGWPVRTWSGWSPVPTSRRPSPSSTAPTSSTSPGSPYPRSSRWP